MPPKILKPDAKGRISLGHLARGVIGYIVTATTDHKIILEPYTEIPVREKWIFEDKSVLKKIEKGIQQAKIGRLSKKDSFVKYADDDTR